MTDNQQNNLIFFLIIFKYIYQESEHGTKMREEILLELVHCRMPFGQYQGRFLMELPEYYLVWYINKGLPGGKLGELMALAYEIKLNGLEYLLEQIKPAVK